MSAVLDQIISPSSRGSHYSKGADYLFYVSQSPAAIWRQPVNPATMIVQQAARALSSGQANNLNSFGASSDLRWVGGTTKQVQAQSGAKVAKLAGATALGQIAPESLASIAWSSILPNNSVGLEDGQSPVGNFYAVQIPVAGGDPHYAKVRIFKDTTTKIEWVSYILGTRPMMVLALGLEFPDPSGIFVNELETEIYVSGGVGEAGYVVKYQRIVAGPFPQYFSSPIPLNISELLSPQQMLVDGGDVYVVAGCSIGSATDYGVFLLQPGSYSQVQVVGGITSAPVGLLLDKQKSSATTYISTGAGQIYVIDISGFQAPTFDSDGNQTGIASAPVAATGPSSTLSLGGPSRFLTWTDDAHTAFYAAVGGAAPNVHRIDLAATSVARELTAADPSLPDPWSVQVFSEGSLTVICDAAIYDVERGIVVTTELLLGIGLIPFDYITNSKNNPTSPGPNDGKADTSSAPGYYFSSYPHLAFGGSLSLLINHQAAWNSNLRFYKLTLTNDSQSRIIVNAFTDLRWNSMANPPRFEAVLIGVQDAAYFPVRNPSELWYNPYLAAIVNTTTSDNGYNRLKIEFFDAQKQPITSASYTRLVYVDNTRSTVSLFNLRRGTSSSPPAPAAYQNPDGCGLIIYDSKNDLIAFDLTAAHPTGNGKYTLSFLRGSTLLFSVAGNLTTSATLQTVVDRTPGVPLRIGDLTGNCDIANITVSLSAPAPGVINGYGWVDLGTYARSSFTLAPSASQPAMTHTPWPSDPKEPAPGGRPALMIGPPVAKK